MAIFQDGEREPLDERATGLGRGDGADAYLYCSCGFNTSGGDDYVVVYIDGDRVSWNSARGRAEAARLLTYPMPPTVDDDDEWLRGPESPLLVECRCGLQSSLEADEEDWPDKERWGDIGLRRSDADDGGWSLYDLSAGDIEDCTDDDILLSGDATWQGYGWDRPNADDWQEAKRRQAEQS